MEPVYILQHNPLHGAGYFQDVLARHDIPHQVHHINPQQPAPPPGTSLSGLALFGGPFNLHDNRLTWLQDEIDFVRRVIDSGLPVLGHGFGGEVVAAALDSAVVRNPVKQIGWFTVKTIHSEESKAWLEDVPDSFELFKWHTQAFEIPMDAIRLFHSDWTPTEAFAAGNVLVFLGHLELTAQMINEWLDKYDDEVAHPKEDPRTHGKLILNWDAIIEGPEMICSNLDERLTTLHRVADKLYGRWAERILTGRAAEF
jgi:GMP synthase-like glutamine amidotransferase